MFRWAGKDGERWVGSSNVVDVASEVLYLNVQRKASHISFVAHTQSYCYILEFVSLLAWSDSSVDGRC